mgnify:CR=1 FL=1
MKRYDLITPEGTRDLLFEGCLARRMVEDRLSKLFEGFGYSEVVTPGIEFYARETSSRRAFISLQTQRADLSLCVLIPRYL